MSELWWALPRLGRAGAGRAVGPLSIWLWWDRYLERRWQSQMVRPGGVLHYRVARHSGRLTLDDGTVIDNGSPVVELHFDNRGLMEMSLDGEWNPWDLVERGERDLVELATLVSAGKLGSVRALHGVTPFASPARRLGFEVRQVPHTLTRSLATPRSGSGVPVVSE